MNEMICKKRDAMSIGIDIGGMSVKLGVVDYNNSILHKKVVAVTKTATADGIVDDIVQICQEFMKQYEIAKIGVGAPGSISKGEVTAPNLPFRNFPLASALERKLHMPIHVENDANCAALGEFKAGAAKSAKNAILITLGTGIGGGIIIDNALYKGSGNAGEIGHLCIESGGKLCNCGRHGCWEQYASVTALIKLTEHAIEAHPQSILAKIAVHNGGVNGETVFLGVEKDCGVSSMVLDEYVTYLADGINSLINIFDPEKILLSGGLSNAGDRLLMPLKQKLQTTVEVSAATLKNDAGIIGAANL